jgi:hypothetical protein
MHGVGVMNGPRGEKWHSEADRFHHTNADCIHAESTDHRARHRGTGGKPLCALCDRLDRIDLELDSHWFPLTF